MRADRWGNVITDVSVLRAEKKMVTKESSGHKDSPICHVRDCSEKIKSRGFYIDSFLLKRAPHTTQLQWTFFFSLNHNVLSNVMYL